MVLSRFSSNAVPDVLEPLLVVGVGDDTQQASRPAGLSVTAGLSQHQNILDIILDDTVGLVWLTEKTTVPGNGTFGGIAAIPEIEQSMTAAGARSRL
jgi:hypothetical protein